MFGLDPERRGFRVLIAVGVVVVTVAVAMLAVAFVPFELFGMVFVAAALMCGVALWKLFE